MRVKGLLLCLGLVFVYSNFVEASVMGDLKGFFYISNEQAGQTQLCYSYSNSVFPSTKVLNKKRYYKGTNISVSTNSKHSLMPLLDGDDLLKLEQVLLALDVEEVPAKDLIQGDCSIFAVITKDSASLEDKMLKVYSNSCSEDSMPNSKSKDILSAVSYSQIVKDICKF